MIDRKLEPLIKREMTKYLGELEDDDLIMFVLEHLKDHKGPQKLVEGLEPVRVQLYLKPHIYCPTDFPVIHVLTREEHTGPRRGSGRVCHQHLATNHLREYGVRRRPTHGEDDGRLKSRLPPLFLARFPRPVGVLGG